MPMTVTSTAFQDGEVIPDEHTPAGANSHPPLTFSEVTKDAKSLALIVEDPDIPVPTASGDDTFVHWLLTGISPATLQIVSAELPLGAVEGLNSSGQIGYTGPRPPLGSGTHRYCFKLFALDTELDLPTDASRQQFYEAIDGHILDQAELVGTKAAQA